MSTKPNARTNEEVPIVAIGASAGGLEPLEKFFSAVPEKPGAAFVVVQHLSPDYRSMMDELLARKSSMPIHRIVDGQTIEANSLYLNRPNMYVELDGNTFRTSTYRSDQGLPHLPIDRLFESLAKQEKRSSIAIVMSGSGSDGTKGAQAIHSAGGAVLVQSVQEAGFTSMPRSVLMTGAVDRVLEAGQMPEAISEILTYGRRSAGKGGRSYQEGIQSILHRLSVRHKVDFNSYKPDSVIRRISRRLSLRNLASIEDYDRLLSESDAALDELFQDILIGVTEFYRDREAIETLRTNVLDALAAEPVSDAPIKVWVSGCASGEEVYTLAIELNEALREAGSKRHFRIIGTDVHSGSIEIASRGLYTRDQIENVPQDRRERYFAESNGKFLIDPVLRQKIIFSTHDLISDPPFMNLDLISCRNLLIYFQEEPQANALSMFMFGLKPNAYLFLGASESLGKYKPYFKTIDAHWRIFRKSATSGEAMPRLPAARLQNSIPANSNHRERPVPAIPQTKPYAAQVKEVRSREALIRGYDSLLKRYAPSSILMTAEGRVLNWFGSAGMFIDTMNNLADWTIQDIVHPDLHFPISVGVEKLRQGQFNSHTRQITLELGDDTVLECAVEVEPLVGDGADWLVLVKIDVLNDERKTEDDVAPRSAAPLLDEDGAVLSGRVHSLERDLRLTEETLQHVTERLEASGEELQASNEELQASNEELQASNEELQSSNEELHAVNEELVSVSAEHERKIEQLSELNATTESVLSYLKIGVMVLDMEDRIRRFSNIIAREFLLQDHDIERSINTVGPHFDFVDLQELTAAVREAPNPQHAEGTYQGKKIAVEVRRIKLGKPIEPVDGIVVLIRFV